MLTWFLTAVQLFFIGWQIKNIRRTNRMLREFEATGDRMRQLRREAERITYGPFKRPDGDN